jgi:hypothetical protein
MSRAVMAGVLLACFVHAEISTATMGLSVVALTVINSVALFRSRETVVIPPVALLLFLTWWGMVGLVHAPDVPYAGYTALKVVALILVATSARTLGARSVEPLTRAAIFALPALLLLALAEIFGLNAPYPRRDGETFRLIGDNSLVPGLGMRVMATTGYAITLGLIAATLAALLVYAAVSSRRWVLLLPAAAGLVVVALSGTRTAVIAVAVAVAVGLVSDRRTRRVALRIGIPILILGVIAIAGYAIASGIVATQSWQHRWGVFWSVGRMFERPWHEVLFGSGFSDVSSLVTSGALGGDSWLGVVDNEFIRVTAGLGLVGVVLLIVSVAAALVASTPGQRVVVVSLVIGALAYDSGTWLSLLVLFVIALAGRADSDSPVRPERSVAERGVPAP